MDQVDFDPVQREEHWDSEAVMLKPDVLGKEGESGYAIEKRFQSMDLRLWCRQCRNGSICVGVLISVKYLCFFQLQSHQQNQPVVAWSLRSVLGSVDGLERRHLSVEEHRHPSAPVRRHPVGLGCGLSSLSVSAQLLY